MAVPTGFEPAFSALTGLRVWPGYTTGPRRAKSLAVCGTRNPSRRRPVQTRGPVTLSRIRRKAFTTQPMRLLNDPQSRPGGAS